jgi:hypothetical protein
MIPAFYSDHLPVRLPPGHPFPIEKYRAIHQRIVEEEIFPEEWLREAGSVDPRILGLAHTPAYLKRAFAGELGREELRRLGLPWSEGLVRRAAASVGGTIEAAWAALEHGLGINLGGGTHHAFPDHGRPSACSTISPSLPDSSSSGTPSVRSGSSTSMPTKGMGRPRSSGMTKASSSSTSTARRTSP